MNKQRGFTLVELMITVLIVAIVLGAGVPAFRGVMRDNRIAAHTNDFLSALSMTRSEALKRGTRVVIQPLTPGNWGRGWRIFVDPNNNAVLDNGEDLIRQYEGFSRNASLTQTGGTNLNNYISFTREGRPFTTANTMQMGTLVLSICDSSNRQAQIMINRAGRWRVIKRAAIVACTD